MAQDTQKDDDKVDVEIPSTGDYNKVPPTSLPALTPEEEEELKKNASPPSNEGDEDDGKYHRTLNFDSSQAEPVAPSSNLDRLKQMIGTLGDRFSQNLQKSNQVIGDSGKMMMDRAIMNANPNLSGPRLPEGTMPAEKQMSDMYANGVAGSMAPVGGLASLVEGAAPAAKAAAMKELQAATEAMFQKNAPAAEQVAQQLGIQKAAPAATQTMADLIRQQQALSRGVDFQQRLAAQTAAAKAAALRKLLGQ